LVRLVLVVGGHAEGDRLLRLAGVENEHAAVVQGRVVTADAGRALNRLVVDRDRDCGRLGQAQRGDHVAVAAPCARPPPLAYAATGLTAHCQVSRPILTAYDSTPRPSVVSVFRTPTSRRPRYGELPTSDSTASRSSDTER